LLEDTAVLLLEDDPPLLLSEKPPENVPAGAAKAIVVSAVSIA
jgi:hypothetical protein